MNKKTLGRVGCAILGIILLISGIYQISKGLSGSSGSSDTDETTKPVMINETVTDSNGVSFCVTDVKNEKSVGEGFYAVTTDNNFIVVSIKITNNGEDPYDVNSLRFLLECNGKEYEYDEETVLTLDNYLSMDTLNPGLSKEYVIVYETPTTTDESEYVMKIKPNAFSEKDLVYITLK